MLIPLRDTNPNRYSGFSVVTMLIIAFNFLIYVYEEILAVQDINLYIQFIFDFGVVPTWVWKQEGLGAISALTTTFLHGSWSHLVGNMIFLWAFGRRVEDACGRWRYICFYFLCGVTASLAHVIIHSRDEITAIGASGSISGIMTAYLLLYPWGAIQTLFFPIPITFKVRAFWLLIYFLFISNVGPALQALLFGADYRVAYWAHLGGLIGGMTIYLFMRPEALYRYWWQDAV